LTQIIADLTVASLNNEPRHPKMAYVQCFHPYRQSLECPGLLLLHTAATAPGPQIRSHKSSKQILGQPPGQLQTGWLPTA
jgi:hypothetical protein